MEGVTLCCAVAGTASVETATMTAAPRSVSFVMLFSFQHDTTRRHSHFLIVNVPAIALGVSRSVGRILLLQPQRQTKEMFISERGDRSSLRKCSAQPRRMRFSHPARRDRIAFRRYRSQTLCLKTVFATR
jgi:hypothetical protein